MKNKEKLRCIFEKLYGRVQESREIKGKKKKKNRNGFKVKSKLCFLHELFLYGGDIKMILMTP
jgi:hypothetical protein